MILSNLKFCAFLFCAQGIFLLQASAQETKPKCGAADYSFQPQEFSDVAGPIRWCRPPAVEYVILQACGGGAGGSNIRIVKTPIPGNFGIDGPIPEQLTGGWGGGAGEYQTILVGPLAQDQYTIVLAGVVSADQPGQDTRFYGTDINIAFRGGLTRQTPDGMSGRSSLFAKGGATPDPRPVPHKYDPTFVSSSGGGGEAGIGDGGSGGEPYKGGGDGGTCAGGGGRGSQTHSVVAGGAGGGGYLKIIPIVLPYLSKNLNELDQPQQPSKP